MSETKSLPEAETTVAAQPETQEKPGDPSVLTLPAEQEQKNGKALAYIARREKASREKEEDLKAREQAFKTKQDELEKQLSDYKGNPLTLLQAYGLSYDDVTNFYLGQLSEKQLEEKTRLAKLEEKVNSREKAEQEEQTKRQQADQEAYYTTWIRDYTTQLNQFIDSSGETYKRIREEKATDLVLDTLSAYVSKFGTIPTFAFLCNQVEQNLRKLDNDSESNKLVQSTDNHASSPTGKSSSKPATSPQKKSAPTKTVTNKQAATPIRKERKLTPDELWAERKRRLGL